MCWELPDIEPGSRPDVYVTNDTHTDTRTHTGCNRHHGGLPAIGRMVLNSALKPAEHCTLKVLRDEYMREETAVARPGTTGTPEPLLDILHVAGSP